MEINDDFQSINMVNSLKTNIGEEAANDFAKEMPLSKTADNEKKFKWAKDACEYLDSRYDDETKKQIRFQCCCNDGSSTAEKMIQYINQTDSMEKFVAMFNKNEPYASLEMDGDDLLFCYPECYCDCVNQVNQLISKTWCYCTIGYVKALFEKVFHKSVKAELLESIKTGGNRCVVKVSI